MALYVIIGSLAAFGALCALWVCAGSLLSGVKTVTILCDGCELQLVHRYLWLRSLGLVRCRLMLVNSQLGLQQQQQIQRICKDIRFCQQQWVRAIDGEREDVV